LAILLMLVWKVMRKERGMAYWGDWTFGICRQQMNEYWRRETLYAQPFWVTWSTSWNEHWLYRLVPLTPCPGLSGIGTVSILDFSMKSHRQWSELVMALTYHCGTCPHMGWRGYQGSSHIHLHSLRCKRYKLRPSSPAQ
jgi:hypothetical protein